MYGQLCLEEREKLYAMHGQEITLREIGKRLNRSDTTIGRELKRNKLLIRGMEKLSGIYIFLVVHNRKQKNEHLSNDHKHPGKDQGGFLMQVQIQTGLDLVDLHHNFQPCHRFSLDNDNSLYV
jgi:hypothetical protein